MNGKNELLIYGIALLALLLLAWSIAATLSPKTQLQNTPGNYARFVASELPDKCKTPEGYTDEQWREHMGHHPDRYRECLQVRVQ